MNTQPCNYCGSDDCSNPTDCPLRREHIRLDKETELPQPAGPIASTPIIVCAWCQAGAEFVKPYLRERLQVTHTICPACKRREDDKLKRLGLI